MEKQNKIFRGLFIGLLAVFGLLTLYAIKSDEPPRFVLFLGRFHPLLLHLPIGALIVTFFIDILGRVQKNYPETIIKYLLGFTAFFAIATCFLGYFLSLEGGYQEATLDLHFYTGILTAIIALVLFIISLKPSFNTNKIFLPLFIVSLISISITGHYGSVLTHGESFLTEYAGLPEKERTIEVVDSIKLYNDVVAKILDKKCMQCHSATKLKGELSLVSEASMLKGGVSGASIKRGDAAASLLYSRLLLPISDEEHMPPEGKAQLTKDEIWLIEHWINSGADFKNYVTQVAENDTLAKKLEKYLVFDKIEIPKASKDDIEDVIAAGFRVQEIVPGEAELNVKYIDTMPTLEAIQTLSKIKEQIIELNFDDAEVTDEMTKVISKFKHLKTLKINSVLLTDAALENLKALEHLEVINLYDTGISNTGIASLLSAIHPKSIYTGNTKVDKATAKRLAEEHKVFIQNNILEGFVEESQLAVPLITPEKTLFMDTIHLNIRSLLKNVNLHYTLDGTDPDSTSQVVTDIIVLDASQTLKVRAYKSDWLPSDILVRDYTKPTHKISSFSMRKQPDERYPDPNKLFDYEEGSNIFSDGHWIGYFGDDLEVTVDMGEVTSVDHISFRCLEDTGSWIFYPTAFTVYGSNSRNGNYRKLGEVEVTREGEGREAEAKKVHIDIPEGAKARYYKIHIKNYKTLPKWHPNAGSPAWLFVDEIYFW